MDLLDGGELIGAIRLVEDRERIAHREPQAAQTLENDTAFGIGDALDGAGAFGGFPSWIDL
ncbi:MAG TPA: hypothetical protein VLX44_10190 [Xanthobacteraceae bacterium]|nr:hypothetical protein [Xanthobacteraceae bacterium]